MRKLRTEADYRQAEQSHCHILIRDSASKPSRHRLPCQHVTLENFHRKVIENNRRNGSYWVIEPGDNTSSLVTTRRCPACGPPSLAVSNSAPEESTLNNLLADLAVKPAVPATPSGGAIVRWPSAEREAFEVWCSKQIDLESKPPDPRGEARKLIQQGLRELHVSPASLLLATYSAPALLPNSDVENVLFTNVDATGGAFRSLVAAGLEFGFLETEPNCPTPEKGLVCCSTYGAVSPDHSNAGWAGRSSIAQWAEVSIPDLSRISRTPALWWALRRAAFTLARSSSAPRRFGVDVGIQVPRGLSFNAAARIKVAIDAVVLCLAAENGESSEEGIIAMAEHAAAPPTSVRALLFDDSKALFGRHRLVDRRGQVSPPDSGCVAGRMVVSDSPDGRWRLSARVVSVP